MFSSTIHILTVSDRATAGVYPDEAGPLAARLMGAAFPAATLTQALVTDGIASVHNGIARACASGARVILTLGGTGLAARDLTVDATTQLISREIPGVAEAIRAKGLETTQRAMFSRGIAGVITVGALGNTHEVVVINIAGSPNAAEVACEVLIPVLPHLANQLDNFTHEDIAAAPTERPLALITQRPLVRAIVERCVVGPEMGAVVTFEGLVRNHDAHAPDEVSRIEYSAHPDAQVTLAEIVNEYTRPSSHPRGEVRVAAHHRVGSLDVGEIAIIVCVAAAHRTDTFTICSEVVEQIKARVPLWKKQFTVADEGTWLGLS
jgi:molybdenum cofactor synthesis domain-containing protein